MLTVEHLSSSPQDLVNLPPLKKIKGEPDQKEKSIDDTKLKAAQTIQKAWHNSQTRKERKLFLPMSLFKIAIPYIDKPDELEKLPSPPQGNSTNVYFLNDPRGAVVIKNYRTPQNAFVEFSRMLTARRACVGYKFVVTPAARVYRNYVVVLQLPIVPDQKAQIAMYVNCVDLFKEAVREFTNFLCRHSLNDLFGGHNCYAPLFHGQGSIPRYENVSLYLEDSVGKIGIVDTKGFLARGSTSQAQCEGAAENAIRFFPFNIDDIVSVTEKFFPDLDYRKVLVAIKENNEKLINRIYVDHREFLRKKQITIVNPIALAPIDQKMITDMFDTVSQFLTCVDVEPKHKSLSLHNCLGKDKEATLEALKKVFPDIVALVQDFITKQLNERSQEFKEKLTQDQLPTLRTIWINTNTSEGYEQFYRAIIGKLTMFKQNGDICYSILNKMLDYLVQQQYLYVSYTLNGYIRCIMC